ncbi:MAG: hypothetical protein J5I98_25035 [Phaeodactylibacter sp.]|nr:hypothetical protein [Phaeodactylibacter sp.]
MYRQVEQKIKTKKTKKMGVALYVQGYKKNEESITGQIKILGWYEVNKNKIESHQIDNSFTVLHDDLKSIELVEKEFYMYGFDDPGELSFYRNLMNGMTGGGFRRENGESYALMFDGKRIYSIISKILNSFDSVPLHGEAKETEKNNLEELQKILKVIAENDGIVGMMWG